jgi:hypothetical protein
LAYSSKIFSSMCSFSSSTSKSRAHITLFFKCGGKPAGFIAARPTRRRLRRGASEGGCSTFLLHLLMCGIGRRAPGVLDNLLMNSVAGLAGSEARSAAIVPRPSSFFLKRRQE